MLLSYLNYAAMVIGYISIAIMLLIVLFFIYLSIQEKYKDWKRSKGMENTHVPQMQASQKQSAAAESAAETSKAAVPEKPKTEPDAK